MGVGPHATTRVDRVPFKELSVIAWWMDYAEAVAERLPDQNMWITPCRTKFDVWGEFKCDMAAAGYSTKDIACVRTHAEGAVPHGASANAEGRRCAVAVRALLHGVQ